jgi:hypothetical protein
MAPNWSRDYNMWSKKEKAGFRSYGTRAGPKAKAKAAGKGQGKGRAPPRPPPLRRSIGNAPRLQASQGTTIGRQRGMKAPIIWKIACADAPTRSTQDYNRFLSSFVTTGTTAVFPGNFKEDTIWVYNPDYAPNQLACWDTSSVIGGTSLDTILRTYDTVSFKPLLCDPLLFGNIPREARVAQLSAALTMCTKFPGSSGMLNIRRMTQLDTTLTGVQLAASLIGDTISTYHLPLTGNQRWNMHCGVHKMENYGILKAVTDSPPNWGYDSTSVLGGLIFSVTNVLTGPAIAQPGVSVLCGSQWTQELTITQAYTKDSAPERSVVDAKNLHAHQSRLAPFETNTKHNSKATVAVLNSLAHGVDSMAEKVKQGGEIAIAGYGIIKAGINATKVVDAAIEGAMIAIV